MDIELPHNGWHPRPHQERLWRYLEEGGRRAIAVWFRRAGKDEVCLHHAARAAMERPGNYAHCLPEFAQGRKSIWTAVNPHTGLRRIDEAFPHEIRANTSDNEMFIRFINGSTWSVMGSDRYDTSIVGSSLAGITFSEYALAKPAVWGFARPMIEENSGWAVFITTPRGPNHAKQLFDHAVSSPEWFAERLTVHDADVFSQEALAQTLAEYMALYGDAGRAVYEQEYECFPPDALVACHDRVRPIAEIVAGDCVLTHTGRIRRVNETMRREYNGELVRIESYGGEPLICTPEHPVLICDPSEQKYFWTPAEAVDVGDWLVTPRMQSAVPIVSEALARIIAWYVCEGSVSGNAITFSIGAHEPEYVAEVVAALEAQGFTSKVTHDGSTKRVWVNSVELADFLVGQCGSKAHNKRLPLSLLRGREEIVWDVLFKGDGCIYERPGGKHTARYSYSTVSHGLAQQVQLIGAALGYTGGCSERESGSGQILGREFASRAAYQVQMGKGDDRGSGKTRAAKNGCLGRVRSVSREPYCGLVYNLSVQGDESYVVNTRSVHNCAWNAAILGAFYGREMAAVRQQGRILEIEPIAGEPVHRAWDIGVRHDTSIWWFQVVGAQVFVLAHYANSGVGLDHYIEIIDEYARKYGFKHGVDYVPHDAKVREFTIGRTRIETMALMGLNPCLVPDHTVADGINAVRRTLPLCVFHPRCEQGISALEQYRREWDDDKRCFRASAVADWTSDSADSFRYLAMAWKPAPIRTPQLRQRPQNGGIFIPPVPPPRERMRI